MQVAICSSLCRLWPKIWLENPELLLAGTKPIPSPNQIIGGGRVPPGLSPMLVWEILTGEHGSDHQSPELSRMQLYLILISISWRNPDEFYRLVTNILNSHQFSLRTLQEFAVFQSRFSLNFEQKIVWDAIFRVWSKIKPIMHGGNLRGQG